LEFAFAFVAAGFSGAPLTLFLNLQSPARRKRFTQQFDAKIPR
jgi:hypothetical protein